MSIPRVETPLRAFHGDPKVKAKYLARVEQHRQADEIIKGTYGSRITDGGGWKGCAVGCTIHGSDHDKYETRLGVPAMLAYLEDQIFEGLPEPRSVEWPAQFLAAITPGADLSRVGPTLLRRMLARRRDALTTLDITPEFRQHVADAITGVMAVLDHWIATGTVDEWAAGSAGSAAASARLAARSAWSAARSAAAWAAESARWSAAWAAESAWSAAAWSAKSAAESAEAAAESARLAAWSAAESAWAAAGSAEYEWLADTLLEALRDAPVAVGAAA